MLNLPTDNLYKFLAISGLVIAMFSVYYPFQKSHELQFLIVEQKAELELRKYQMGRYDEKFKLQQEQLSTAETSEKKISVLDNIDKDLIEYAKAQTNSEMKPPRSKLRGITRKGIVCETPRFLTLFPLQGNLEASSEESPD